MKTYDFYGSILTTEIGRELRAICKKESKSFKLLTGYGSTSGIANSKHAAIKSLRKMRKEGLIKDFFSGEVLTDLQTNVNGYEYEVKNKYTQTYKNDKDCGNKGVIFVIKN